MAPLAPPVGALGSHLCWCRVGGFVPGIFGTNYVPDAATRPPQITAVIPAPITVRDDRVQTKLNRSRFSATTTRLFRRFIINH